MAEPRNLRYKGFKKKIVLKRDGSDWVSDEISSTIELDTTYASEIFVDLELPEDAPLEFANGSSSSKILFPSKTISGHGIINITWRVKKVRDFDVLQAPQKITTEEFKTFIDGIYETKETYTSREYDLRTVPIIMIIAVSDARPSDDRIERLHYITKIVEEDR